MSGTRDDLAPIDWAARWAAQVAARAAQVTRLRPPVAGEDAYWAGRARLFQASTGIATEDDPVLACIRPWLTPECTVLDVGAGAGRYALAIAPLVRTLTAVEPSRAMAGLLRQGAEARGLANLRVIERRWEESTGEAADVVFCAHVLYPIADVAPFLLALDQAARQRCVLVLRERGPEAVLREAWLALHGEPPRSDPAFIEAYALLWQLGIAANVQFVPGDLHLRFGDRAEALAWSRDILWAPDDVETNRRLWPHLEPLLEGRADGSLVLRPTGQRTAVVWWERR